MAKQLLNYYAEAKRIGGLTAQMRLAVITKVPGTRAGKMPDSPDLIAKFENALGEIKKNLNKR